MRIFDWVASDGSIDFPVCEDSFDGSNTSLSYSGYEEVVVAQFLQSYDHPADIWADRSTAHHASSGTNRQAMRVDFARVRWMRDQSIAPAKPGKFQHPRSPTRTLSRSSVLSLTGKITGRLIHDDYWSVFLNFDISPNFLTINDRWTSPSSSLSRCATS